MKWIRLASGAGWISAPQPHNLIAGCRPRPTFRSACFEFMTVGKSPSSAPHDTRVLVFVFDGVAQRVTGRFVHHHETIGHGGSLKDDRVPSAGRAAILNRGPRKRSGPATGLRSLLSEKRWICNGCSWPARNSRFMTIGLVVSTQMRFQYGNLRFLHTARNFRANGGFGLAATQQQPPGSPFT